MTFAFVGRWVNVIPSSRKPRNMSNAIRRRGLLAGSATAGVLVRPTLAAERGTVMASLNNDVIPLPRIWRIRYGRSRCLYECTMDAIETVRCSADDWNAICSWCRDQIHLVN